MKIRLVWPPWNEAPADRKYSFARAPGWSGALRGMRSAARGDRRARIQSNYGIAPRQRCDIRLATCAAFVYDAISAFPGRRRLLIRSFFVKTPSLGAILLSLVPFAAMCFSVAVWDRIEPMVAGLPFNIFWLISWIVLTPVCMWGAYSLEGSRQTDSS